MSSSSELDANGIDSSANEVRCRNATQASNSARPASRGPRRSAAPNANCLRQTRRQRAAIAAPDTFSHAANGNARDSEFGNDAQHRIRRAHKLQRQRTRRAASPLMAARCRSKLSRRFRPPTEATANSTIDSTRVAETVAATQTRSRPRRLPKSNYSPARKRGRPSLRRRKPLIFGGGALPIPTMRNVCRAEFARCQLRAKSRVRASLSKSTIRRSSANCRRHRSI